jgi:hypothetical protein
VVAKRSRWVSSHHAVATGIRARLAISWAKNEPSEVPVVLRTTSPIKTRTRPLGPVWPAPGVHKAHIELAGGRSRSRMSLIIPDDQQPFYPDLRERIKVGDELLVVAPEDQRGKIEDRLRDVASVVGSPAHATDEERVRRFDVAVRATRAALFTMPGSRNVGQPRVRRQPRSGLGRWPLGLQIGVIPPPVHVTFGLHLAGCAFQFDWCRPGPNPRVRSADPRQRICDSRRRSSRLRPDQESPIDPAQGRARGQTTPPPARPLQNQPSRLVDGVTVQGGVSLPRRQAISLLAPTTTRKVR